MANFTKAQKEEIKRLMAIGMSETEAEETVLYDEAVEKGESTEFDLTEEQAKVAKKYTAVDTKKRSTEYTFTKRERKPNESKRELIEILKKALENAQILPNLSNIDRQIDFLFDNKQFSITLTEHRQKKTKWKERIAKNLTKNQQKIGNPLRKR